MKGKKAPRMAIQCPKCHTENPDTLKFCGECGTQLPPPKDVSWQFTETLDAPIKELARGSIFARRYEIIEELGKGGMGKVYRVFDKKIDEEVALKLIKPEIAADKETIKRFSNELKLARKIAHRNVGKMYELMEEEGAHFITMEYVPGENLRSMIRMSGQLGIGTAVSVGKQVCEGLSEAHRLGVVHRDLKPSNIMIDKEGNARIMDFGIARSLKGKGITGAGVMIGTPEYMSPEQVEGKEVDQRSDIYSLGVILYEMLTGQVPFEGDTPFTVGVKQKSEIPKDPKLLNAQIPQDLSRLILRCLEKDKAKRYQSVEALSSDLKKIESGLTPTSSIIRPISLAKPKRRKMILAAGAGIVILAVAAAAFFIVRSTRLNVNPKRVVVAPFENKTGDPSLDSIGSVAADWIAQGISQAAQIEVVPGMAAQESFRAVEREIGELRGIKQLRALAKETKAGVVVSGTYYLQGDELQFQANITDVRKGKVIHAVPSVAGKKENPMEVIKSLQKRLMGAIATQYDIQIGAFILSSPPTFEGYQEYLRGCELYGKDYSKCIEHLNKALELDPAFLLPKALIATGYHNQGNYEKAQEIFEELDRKRTQLDQFSRLWVDTMMAEMRGQLEESLRYCRQAAELMSNMEIFAINVGLWEIWLNRPQKAIEEFSKIDLKKAELNRWGFGSWIFSVWSDAYHMVGKYKKELEIVQMGKKYFPENAWFLAIEARSNAAQKKTQKVREIIEKSLTSTSADATPADVMFAAAYELREQGLHDESKSIANQAIDWYKGRPAEEAAIEVNRYYLGLTLYLAERWQEAQNVFETLLAEKPDNIDYKGYLGTIAARLGDKEKALKISDEFKALTKPYLFGIHFYYRACIASLLGEKEQAVVLLRESYAQGLKYGVYLHNYMDLEPLRDYPPFGELLRPKG